jgi:hypothetical protein
MDPLPKLDVVEALNCHPYDRVSRQNYPEEVGLLLLPPRGFLSQHVLEIIDVHGKGVLETIQWSDMIEYSAFKQSNDPAEMEIFQFTVNGMGLLQFECNDAEVFVGAFESCLRQMDAKHDCYLCFTWQDPAGFLPEEVSAPDLERPSAGWIFSSYLRFTGIPQPGRDWC